MSSTGDYPLGAENNENAPYNEKKNEYLDFNVCISQTLSKNTSIKSNDYKKVKEWDDEFYYNSIDTSEMNYKAITLEQHYTPMELITLFKEFLEVEVQKTDFFDDSKIRIMKNLIEECNNWTEDETEVILENVICNHE